MQCLNCETQFEGNYCPQCNQKSSTKRLSVLTVIQDFLNAISDSEKGFLKTVIDLSQNPGQTINNYIKGKRSRYLSAGKYTFFITVLFTINITYLEHHFGMFESLINSLDDATVSLDEKNNIHIGNSGVVKKENFKEVKENEKIDINFDFLGKHIEKKASREEFLAFIQKIVPHFHRTLFDILKFLIIVWIPIFAFFSYFIFFKAPYNFAEHITFNSYVFSHLLLIMILTSPAYWIFPGLGGVTFSATMISALFYIFYSYMQFFEMRPYRLLKSGLAVSLSLFTYITTLFVLMIALAIYIAVENIHLL